MNWRIPLHHQRIWRCESQHLVCLCIGLLAQLLGGAIGLTSLEGLWSSFSHQFLTLTLASKTQSQAARQTSAKVLAKCLRETSKKDAFNIPWNVPMRCLKFDSLKFSLKKVGSKINEKIELKNQASRLQWSGSCDEKNCGMSKFWSQTPAMIARRSNYWSCFPKVLALRLLQAWKGNHSLQFLL